MLIKFKYECQFGTIHLYRLGKNVENMRNLETQRYQKWKFQTLKDTRSTPTILRSFTEGPRIYNLQSLLCLFRNRDWSVWFDFGTWTRYGFFRWIDFIRYIFKFLNQEFTIISNLQYIWPVFGIFRSHTEALKMLN